MTTDHPITPPLELVEQLRASAPHGIRDAGVTRELHLIAAAFAAGANQELEACVEWVSQWCGRWPDGTQPETELRAARRPKPPSLKEQALRELGGLEKRVNLQCNLAAIRRAIEALND